MATTKKAGGSKPKAVTEAKGSGKKAPAKGGAGKAKKK